MIREAYVSFETAQLLKEKGFDEPCRTWYNVETMHPTFDNNVCNKFIDTNSRYGMVSAPTHQMALAWLREKNLCVFIAPAPIRLREKYGNWEAGIYFCDDCIDATVNACGHIYGNTYEETVEAALKYALENLI